LEGVDDVDKSASLAIAATPRRSTLSLDAGHAAMLNYYPLFIALTGFVVAAALTQRALLLMQPDAKVALMDASASTRFLTILVTAVFIGLIIWRPVVAWVFLGVAYFCLAVRSIVRVQYLHLPTSISRLLQAANLTACFGMVICACIFGLRALQ
jgi:hypothetical protein